MMKTSFLVLVFCCCVLAKTSETGKSHIVTKRAAEKPTELQLENDLRRVKRIMEPQDALSRTKRMRRQNIEQDLSRMKREKRSVRESGLSRMKRGNVKDSVVSPALSRVKRFNDLKDNLATLVRVKRLRRSAFQAFEEPNLSRVKRNKRSLQPVEFAMHTLSRMKRFHDPNTVELSRVKRTRRSAAMMKRIPPDLHKLKRLRNRNLAKMTKAKREHFKAMKGYSTRHNDLHKRGNHSRNVESFKQRVQKRLRSRHRKRFNHKKEKTKKDRHHVQSHRLNKKSLV